MTAQPGSCRDKTDAWVCPVGTNSESLPPAGIANKQAFPGCPKRTTGTVERAILERPYINSLDHRGHRQPTQMDGSMDVSVAADFE